jgi:hypothetical protein
MRLFSSARSAMMLMNAKVRGLLLLTAGALLGYAATAGRNALFPRVRGQEPGTVRQAAGAAKTEPGGGRKWHIAYIVADDLGWKDVGFHGSDIKTPNLDKLAATGARLEQFYAQPMCTPTRACLMTGRYPFRYGLQTAVIPSAHTYGLPTDEWL